MPRTVGSRNADFEAKRRALLGRIRDSLFSATAPSSFRGMAQAAGVSVPTLRHYFQDRETVLSAVLEDYRQVGARPLEITAIPHGTFADSIRQVLEHTANGFRYGGLTEANALGLTEGLSHVDVARSYLSELLEPTIEAFQTRLEAHIEAGEMRNVDTRSAAIGLVAPLLVIFLHQDALGGSVAYPTDIDDFLSDQVHAFVRAYALDSGASTDE